jgi:hypothetical protein
LSNKHDVVDSIKIQKTTPSVTIVSIQPSLTIDYRELQIGKLVGSGEFAG